MPAESLNPVSDLAGFTRRNGIQSILWLGTTFDEAVTQTRRAISPAASRWQSQMVKALRKCGVTVRMLGHIPEPAWPRGALFVDAAEPGDHDLSVVPYMNAPGLRLYSLSEAYLRHARPYLKSGNPPDAVVSYNTAPQVWRIGSFAKSLGIPWIALVADAPSRFPQRQFHDLVASAADGRVYLSWFEGQRAREPKLHLDGGIDLVPHRAKPARQKCPAVLYSGTLSRYGGVNLLLRAFALIRDPEAELWICGKGSRADLGVWAQDPRIKFLGYVSEERLNDLSRNCWVFVNPRPSDISENRSNFPSKLLHYLSYSKPVISTWTDGLSPDYKSVLLVLDDETPQCLAHAIEQVFSWNADQYAAVAEQIEAFVERGHSWEDQAARLLDWINRECMHPN